MKILINTLTNTEIAQMREKDEKFTGAILPHYQMGGAMKKIIGIVILSLLFASPAFAAPFLACDPPLDGAVITQTQIEITKDGATTVVNGIATVQGQNFLLYDLATTDRGTYTFRARWAEASGWFSDWSDPMTGRKIGKPGLRIVP